VAQSLGLRTMPVVGIAIGVCSTDRFRPWPPLLLHRAGTKQFGIFPERIALPMNSPYKCLGYRTGVRFEAKGFQLPDRRQTTKQGARQIMNDGHAGSTAAKDAWRQPCEEIQAAIGVRHNDETTFEQRRHCRVTLESRVGSARSD
jgi:hypothetical protein